MTIERRRIETYRSLFCNREDVYARQRQDGSYVLLRQEVSDAVIASHLRGSITAGFYALDRGGRSRWAVVDADRADGLERLQQVFLELAQSGLPSYLEKSRRGGHLWLFLESPIPASGLRRLVRAAVRSLEGLELYPKQDALREGGVGSLIRGPLGVHLLSGKRYPFLDPISLQPVSPTVGGTIDFLGQVEKVSLSRAAEVVARGQLEKKPPAPKLRDVPLVPRNVSAVERAKIQLGALRSFVEQYTSLDDNGAGSCPLHPPDYHPSFAITDDGKRWTCFHQHIGGDVLDLYMRLEEISSYKEAVGRVLGYK